MFWLFIVFHNCSINLILVSIHISFHIEIPTFSSHIWPVDPIQVQEPGGQALSSVEAQQLSATSGDVGKPQSGGLFMGFWMGFWNFGWKKSRKMDGTWWNMMEVIEVHDIWDPRFSPKRYPNVQTKWGCRTHSLVLVICSPIELFHLIIEWA